jgi:hypothetical protein
MIFDLRGNDYVTMRLNDYTALGHKLRFFRRWKAQFMTVGIIYFYAI